MRLVTKSFSNRQTAASMNDRRPRVVYWNNIPSPYMVDRFNSLARRGNVEIEAWFNRRREPDRSWDVLEKTWEFTYRYLPSISWQGRQLTFPTPMLSVNADLLVSLYAEPAFVVGWLLARARGIKTCFRVLKTYDAWVRRSALKNRIKRSMFSRVDAIETTGSDGRAYAIANGARTERIFLATHTVDFQYMSAAADQVRTTTRAFLREKYVLVGCVFIYVGRLWKGKGLETLIAAFAEFQRNAIEASLLLIGDGEEENALRERVASLGLRNVVFMGFQQRSNLPQYLAIADVFVFPTLGDPYGLVVDEAMACGLPIISTSAAGEINARVHPNRNGAIVDPGNVEALYLAMKDIAIRSADWRKMGNESRELVRKHTPDQWAKDFELLVEAVLSR